jgi:sucrose-6F-phosphate phosphohydrolase
MKQYLICTDLDRTLIPNGAVEEAPLARPRFANIVKQENVQLAYVSGRSLALVEDAITEFGLQRPQTVIADVGASIYHATDAGWLPDENWQNKISENWQGKSWHALVQLLEDIPGIRLQDEQFTQQCRYKLSYFTEPNFNSGALPQEIQNLLYRHQFLSRAIWSLDEAKNLGLLDILPLAASKLHAIEFLLQRINLAAENCLFCGDSGNDLEALTSHIPSVLVANASPETRRLAIQYTKRLNNIDKLFLAQYQTESDNGNYAGGILQGIQHFFPELYSA